MKYRDITELCNCDVNSLDDFQAELNHDANIAYEQGIVATSKYYKDFETGLSLKLVMGMMRMQCNE